MSEPHPTGNRLMFEIETRQQLRIPLRSHAGDVVLYVPLPMSAEDWAHLMGVLTAMRPGIVADADETDPKRMTG